jgi:hypothetical protein
MDNLQFNQLMTKLDEISKKLNVLIAPQFKRELKKQDKEITHENIRKLKDCGLDYLEIAGILDMSSGTVANELTNMKKKKKVNEKQESPTEINTGAEEKDNG